MLEALAKNSLGLIRCSQVWEAQPEDSTQEGSNDYSRDLARAERPCARLLRETVGEEEGRAG